MKQWLNYIKHMIPVAVRYNSVFTKSNKRTYKLNLNYMQPCTSLIILSLVAVMDEGRSREEQ